MNRERWCEGEGRGSGNVHIRVGDMRILFCEGRRSSFVVGSGRVRTKFYLLVRLNYFCFIHYLHCHCLSHVIGVYESIFGLSAHVLYFNMRYGIYSECIRNFCQLSLLFV